MTRTSLIQHIVALFALLILPSCHGSDHHDHVPVVHTARTVAIEVEVYDPLTGGVWQDVQVRIVEADQEWAGLIYENPITDDWLYTDSQGLVFLDEYELAIADVGFQLDEFDRAIIYPGVLEDEAIVLLEVYAPGLGSVLYEVDLSWDEPSIFVSLEF